MTQDKHEPSITASFDTNCLSDILKDIHKTQLFISSLSKLSKIIVLLPGDVLTELHAGTRSDLIAQRIRNLLHLWDGIGDDRIQFTPEIQIMIRKELGKRIYFTPVIKPAQKGRLKVLLQEAGNGNQPTLNELITACGEINQDKKDILDLDKIAAQHLQDKAPVDSKALSDFEGYFEAYPYPAHCLQWLLDSTLKNIEWEGFRPGLEEVGIKSRYKIFRFFLAMNELTILAAGLQGRCKHQVVDCFKPKKGNWHDNKIAASAARSSFLVTQDQDLAKKVTYLRDKKVTCLQVLTFDQFISLQ